MSGRLKLDVAGARHCSYIDRLQWAPLAPLEWVHKELEARLQELSDQAGRRHRSPHLNGSVRGSPRQGCHHSLRQALGCRLCEIHPCLGTHPVVREAMGDVESLLEVAVQWEVQKW